ncbi:hypothetical protein ACFWPU_35945 [Streptomyces sp. NPDC058471]|uniref:hypothetical protein n=1 Tax=Streptomyces sp. NPDC058471 TaxID=3346516 RepID=UPI003665733C
MIERTLKIPAIRPEQPTSCKDETPPRPTGAQPVNPLAQPDAWHLVLTDVYVLAFPISIKASGLEPWKSTQDLVNQIRLQLPHLHAPEGTL